MIELYINFWKPSGKWYDGEIIKVSGKYQLWEQEFKDEIRATQNQLMDNALSEFHITLTHVGAYEDDPDADYFYQVFWPAGTFK